MNYFVIIAKLNCFVITAKLNCSSILHNLFYYLKLTYKQTYLIYCTYKLKYTKIN